MISIGRIRVVLRVGTQAGLDRYNPSTNGFDHFKSNPNHGNSLSGDAIGVIFEDLDRQLWHRHRDND